MRTETRFTRRSAKAASCLAGLLALLSAAALEAEQPIGLSAVRAQAFFNEEVDNNPPQTDDRFGLVLAAGDFNGDGAQDLATGLPFDAGPLDLPLIQAGAVLVRWGSPGTGLTSAIPTLLSLFASGGQAQARDFDHFGSALAAGDFNRDGRDDLAVGIPGLGECSDLLNCQFGGVQIHYGQPGGIEVVGGELLFAGPDANVPDLPEQASRLGSALAVGDFDGDGFDDLAMGERLVFQVGAVVVVHGSSEGLIPTEGPVVGYLIHQDDPPVPDGGENNDYFGYALAAGNFNGDGRCDAAGCRDIDDLAMSAIGEDGIGAVMVMMGTDGGLHFATSIYLGQGDVGAVGEADDRFGWSLAAGNFDGDYRCLGIFCFALDDLAIGTPHEDLGGNNEFVDAGEVTVLYGNATGFFDFPRTDHLRQSSIFGSSIFDQAGDNFGLALTTGDFDRDGRDDLAIGQPGENLAGADRGGVTILMGAAGGLYDRFRFLAAGINGVQPGPQDGSRMGYALCVGDFDGTGHADLAIGIPNRDQAGIGDAGAESILYGALFADGFASGNTAYWSVTN